MSSDRSTSNDRLPALTDREVREALVREAARASTPSRVRWTFGLSGWLASSTSGGEDEFVLA